MNLADIADWLRSVVCWFLGHRIVEQTDGSKLCVRCRRKIVIAPF